MATYRIPRIFRQPLLVLPLLAGLAAGSFCCDEGSFTPGGNGPEGDADLCSQGATKCDSLDVMVCQKDADGKLGWAVQSNCTPGYQTCRDTTTGAVCENLPSCTDGKKNQTETDVDCGGSCSPCAQAKACKADKDCITKACINGVCRPCRGGTHSCYGNFVRVCRANNSGWDTTSTCDVTKNEACNPKTFQCEPVQTLGSAKPTGTYYLFAVFEQGKSDFKGGYDVDGYGDRLYVNRSTQLDVYKVELEDSDKDGKLEPNQHPEYEKNKGPKEQRKLTFLKTYTNVKLGTPSVGEIYATKDRIYFIRRDGSNHNIYEFDWGTGQTKLVLEGQQPLCCLGYDEQTKQWYGANNSAKRYVYSFYPKAKGWATEFLYPDLAGSHLDGIEVVTDPKSKISYVYVSDMTSDFLAQYYRDPTTNTWVQKNVFEYKEDQNQLVEGMGFGAYQHFWITGGKTLYEVGGGDLQKFVGIK